MKLKMCANQVVARAPLALPLLPDVPGFVLGNFDVLWLGHLQHMGPHGLAMASKAEHARCLGFSIVSVAVSKGFITEQTLGCSGGCRVSDLASGRALHIMYMPPSVAGLLSKHIRHHSSRNYAN